MTRGEEILTQLIGYKPIKGDLLTVNQCLEAMRIACEEQKDYISNKLAKADLEMNDPVNIVDHAPNICDQQKEGEG